MRMNETEQIGDGSRREFLPSSLRKERLESIERRMEDFVRHRDEQEVRGMK